MSYRVFGSICEEESGRPLAGLRVRVYDKDLVVDDFVGEARTDAQGHFEVRFTESQFRDLHETRPDVYLRVFDASGKRSLHSTKRQVRRDAELDERFDLRIPRGALLGD